jgi:hypothetical protein
MSEHHVSRKETITPVQKFQKAMQQILSVPKAELLRREAEYKRAKTKTKRDRSDAHAR